MSVFIVKEDSEGTSGTRNRKGERTYVRNFTVTCTVLGDDSGVVLADPRLPRMWMPYATPQGFVDFGCWCEDITATRVKKGATTFKVVARYSNKLDRPDIQQIENPLLRPADISWDTNSTAVPALTDADGNTYRNSAGDPFDPPIEENVRSLVLRITRNQAEYDPLFYIDYEDSTNDAVFMNFKKGAVRCIHIKGTRAFENGMFYWKVDMQFEMKKERIPTNVKYASAFTPPDDESKSWYLYVLDRGFREKRDGRKIACLDPYTKQVLSTPALLDGTGLQLSVTAKPWYLGFRRFPTKDFNALQLI